METLTKEAHVETRYTPVKRNGRLVYKRPSKHCSACGIQLYWVNGGGQICPGCDRELKH